jgi:hypothetical protein
MTSGDLYRAKAAAMAAHARADTTRRKSRICKALPRLSASRRPSRAKSSTYLARHDTGDNAKSTHAPSSIYTVSWNTSALLSLVKTVVPT